jgi:hypothetical protein
VATICSEMNTVPATRRPPEAAVSALEAAWRQVLAEMYPDWHFSPRKDDSEA